MGPILRNVSLPFKQLDLCVPLEDHVKWKGGWSPVRDVKIVYSISTLVLFT